MSVTTTASFLSRSGAVWVAPHGGIEGSFMSMRSFETDACGSPRAAVLLEDWGALSRHFTRVAPVSEVARIERAHEGDTTDRR